MSESVSEVRLDRAIRIFERIEANAKARNSKKQEKPQ